MVSTSAIVRRLEAYAAGRPLRRGETKHLTIADDDNLLVVAFVRMGGESRPWGVAYGHPRQAPSVLTVPEARDRTLVAQIAAKFAPALLRHLRTPGFARHPPGGSEDLEPLRQIWLPNTTHLDMLHHVAFAYARTRAGGALRNTLNALGRACGWLFREQERPGQQTVLTATAALRSSYVFPCEDARQGHLGYLLAWLTSKGGFERRLRAASAEEQLSIATSLNPTVERELEPLVVAWNKSHDGGDTAGARRNERGIRARLVKELTRRFELVVRAIDVLREDPRRSNRGLDELVKETIERQWVDFVRLEVKREAGENPFVPAVETDRHPAGAAFEFLLRRAAAERMEQLLVHDDRELLGTCSPRPIWSRLSDAARMRAIANGGGADDGEGRPAGRDPVACAGGSPRAPAPRRTRSAAVAD